ncbi:hypothetical protein LSTR_LSTR000543 [Laodelphax striatellus]|uniref:Uncharacterized protein n=1 Tax=Laodelphax striatellus TaxID=195883 RepID=A0A482XH45_LAOST|nr:hypothetical protein LSTR_LSTR000543 [Laodelphax striatellus]
MAHIEIRPALLITPLLLFTMIPHSQTNVIKSQPMELDVEERPINLEDPEVENDSGFMDFEKFKETLSNFFGEGQPDKRDTNKIERQAKLSASTRAENEELSRDERDVQLDKPPLSLQMVENLDPIEDTRKQANFPEERKDAASSGSGGSIPFLPTGNSEPNKEGGSIPFLPGGSIPEIPGMQGLEGQMTNVPKLVWGGFFFVETPMPGASLSNLASVMSMMQNGQQMVPSQLTNGLMPQSPVAG